MKGFKGLSPELSPRETAKSQMNMQGLRAGGPVSHFPGRIPVREAAKPQRREEGVQLVEADSLVRRSRA